MCVPENVDDDSLASCDRDIRILKQIYLFMIRLSSSDNKLSGLRVTGDIGLPRDQFGVRQVLISKRKKREELEFLQLFNKDSSKAIDSFLSVRGPGMDS